MWIRADALTRRESPVQPHVMGIAFRSTPKISGLRCEPKRSRNRLFRILSEKCHNQKASSRLMAWVFVNFSEYWLSLNGGR